MLDSPTSARIVDVSVLLVEDDPGDAVLVQACLAQAGVAPEAITWTRNLADALVALDSPPRCVLLDLGLPDADGFTAVHKVVDAAPDIAVIVLTGGREHDGVAALTAGAQDYLVKDSITGETLERSIRYAIERKRAQQIRQQLRDARLSAFEQARLGRGLLPKPLLHSNTVECATYYRPGRDGAVLGGDFLDVVETADGRVRAVIGDVMGHGPDEAALGVHLRVAWRTLVLSGVPDEHLLPALAVLLDAEDYGNNRYATVCDLTIEPSAPMTIRVAGHPAPLLSDGDSTRYLDLRIGPPLGVERGPGLSGGWPANRVAIGTGASVFLYTDGLLEAYSVDPESASLGITELVSAVASCARTGGSPGSWIPALVGNAPQQSIDDTAVVVLTVMPPAR